MPNGLEGVSQERYRTLALKFGKEAFSDLNDPKVKFWIISKEDHLYKILEQRYKTITTDKNSLKTAINCTINQLFREYSAGLEYVWVAEDNHTTCFIEKMKKKYPNGMSGNFEKEFEEAMDDCLKNYPDN